MEENKVGDISTEDMERLLETHDFLFDYSLHSPTPYNNLFILVHKRRDKQKYHFMVSGQRGFIVNDWFDSLQELRDIQPFDFTKFRVIGRGSDL